MSEDEKTQENKEEQKQVVTKEEQTQTKEDETYDLDVGGEKRTVTLEEMRTLASKSAGADKSFRDAAAEKKEGAEGIRIKELVSSLSANPNEQDTKELAVLLGIEPGEFMEYLKETDDGKPPQSDDKGGKVQDITKTQLKAGMKELGLDPVEVKSVLDFSHKRHIDAARVELREISDKAVDKDEIFGKMIVGEKKEDRLAVIKDMVAEDVLKKIQDGVPYGAEMVVASVQKIRSLLTKFGIPGKPDQYPVVLGLGPGGGLPAEINSDEPIKRVSSDKDEDEKNLIARYTQKMIQKAREAVR